MALEQIVLEPEVTEPGRDVHVSAAIPEDYEQADSLVAKLFDPGGRLTTESRLAVCPGSVTGDLTVPSEARDGFYEVVVALRGAGRLTATLMVLSKSLRKSLRKAQRAEQERNLAYKLAKAERLAEAAKHLAKAEDLYCAGGWPDREAETTLERAHVLEKIGCSTECQEARRGAMLKFHQAGLQSRASRAYVDARFHFEKAVELAKGLCDVTNETINRNNLGEVLLHLGHVREAQENLMAALEGALTLHDKAREARVRKNLGAAYALQQQLARALSELREAGKLFAEINELQRMQEANQIVSELEAGLQRDAAFIVGIEPAPIGCDPASVVDRVKQQLVSLADERKITLKTDVPSDLPRIQVDADQLERDLSNLVVSVLDATPATGSICVTAHPELVGGESGITLVVDITGYGAAGEAASKVFAPKRVWLRAATG